jgi:hypothetical protein
MLLKSAYTGIAASIVNGKTTHIIGCLSLNSKGKLSDETKVNLQEFWRYIRYLIIDGCSMIAKAFLASLSWNISIGVTGSSDPDLDQSFGGINVLCGDFSSLMLPYHYAKLYIILAVFQRQSNLNWDVKSTNSLALLYSSKSRCKLLTMSGGSSWTISGMGELKNVTFVCSKHWSSATETRNS